MAIVKINPNECKLNDATALALTAMDASDGIYINFDGCTDTKVAVVLQNTATSAGSVVVKMGDAIGGVADVTVTVPASGIAVLTVESSNFMLTSGDHKHHVHLTGPSTVKVGAAALP